MDEIIEQLLKNEETKELAEKLRAEKESFVSKISERNNEAKTYRERKEALEQEIEQLKQTQIKVPEADKAGNAELQKLKNDLAQMQAQIEQAKQKETTASLHSAINDSLLSNNVLQSHVKKELVYIANSSKWEKDSDNEWINESGKRLSDYIKGHVDSYPEIIKASTQGAGAKIGQSGGSGSEKYNPDWSPSKKAEWARNQNK